MSYAPKRSAAAANAACNAMAVLLNGGSLKLYTVGSGVPSSCSVAISDQTLLGTLTLSNPAFGSATNGVASDNTITADSDADNTGTASFFRGLNSGGTCVIQGLCGTSGSDLNINSLSIIQHTQIIATSLTLTESLG